MPGSQSKHPGGRRGKCVRLITRIEVVGPQRSAQGTGRVASIFYRPSAIVCILAAYLLWQPLSFLQYGINLDKEDGVNYRSFATFGRNNCRQIWGSLSAVCIPRISGSVNRDVLNTFKCLDSMSQASSLASFIRLEPCSIAVLSSPLNLGLIQLSPVLSDSLPR